MKYLNHEFRQTPCGRQLGEDLDDGLHVPAALLGVTVGAHTCNGMQGIRSMNVNRTLGGNFKKKVTIKKL